MPLEQGKPHLYSVPAHEAVVEVIVLGGHAGLALGLIY